VTKHHPDGPVLQIFIKNKLNKYILGLNYKNNTKFIVSWKLKIGSCLSKINRDMCESDILINNNYIIRNDNYFYCQDCKQITKIYFFNIRKNLKFYKSQNENPKFNFSYLIYNKK
jgi:hypothetical protein